MPCWNTCEPSRPCGAAGCVNAPHPPNSMPGHPGRSSEGCPFPPNGGGRHEEQSSWYRGNARIGVGYTSAGDLDMEVHSDGVIRGHQSIHLGSGNRAGRDFRAQVVGNTVDPTHELRIGVGNVSGGRSDLLVSQNDLRGSHGSEDIGVGSYSGGTVNIVVAGNRWGQAPHPPDGDQMGHGYFSRTRR